MDKLKKMYEKQTSSDLADIVSGRSRQPSRGNSVDPDAEESITLLKTGGGLVNAAESIVNSRS